MQVSFTALALADIEHIRAYIANDNPAAAARMAAALTDAADRLSANPRFGRLGAVSGKFEVVVRPYVLVYEINRAEIVILRVWHGRQRRPGT
jgi:toxin ParE1/3/4